MAQPPVELTREQLVYLNHQLRQVSRPELKSHHLEMVPEFRGEPEILQRYIENSERLIREFGTEDVDCFQNEFLSNSLIAKIRGDAARVIFSHSLESWEDVKTALLATYGDKRDLY